MCRFLFISHTGGFIARHLSEVRDAFDSGLACSRRGRRASLAREFFYPHGRLYQVHPKRGGGDLRRGLAAQRLRFDGSGLQPARAQPQTINEAMNLGARKYAIAFENRIRAG
jgi:hypothetical protein